MADETSSTRRAGCVCGQVRIFTSGEAKRVGLCHCLDCRKAHAAPFVACVIFPADKVTVDPVADTLGSIESRTGYTRYFCKRCGSRVFGRDRNSDEIELYLGSFDDINLWTPTYECWTKRREGWLGGQPSVADHFSEDRVAKTSTRETP
jgi:hypothetical protein